MKKTLSIILALLICFTTCFGGVITVFAGSTTYTIPQMEGKYKTQGRTEVKNDMLLIDYSASGIQFKANCSGSVSVDMSALRIDSTEDRGGLYFTVIVDGVVQSADKRIPEDNNEANWLSNSTGYPFFMQTIGDYTFEIAKDLPEGEHTFEIYMQTQAYKASFDIKSVTLNGILLDAPKDNNLLIEIVGDSIAAGHGNIATGGDSNERALYTDATRGWGYLTARALNADWSVIATSGITATDNLSWAGPNGITMNMVYPYTRYYSDSSTTYGFERPADVILVSLGTNDVWLYQDTDRGFNLTDEDLKNSFKTSMTLFREKNPNAKIVWLYGMLTSDANTMITDAVAEMGGAEEGYYSLKLPYNGSGGSGHPGLAAQTEYANTITSFIKKDILGEETVWNGTTAAPEGKGTEAEPYLIASAEELAYVIYNGGGANNYYKLTKDIYLNDIHNINWDTGEALNGYVPNSWYNDYKISAAFDGTIDGNGHKVYGLYLDMKPESYSVYNGGTGLIPKIAENSNVTIKNLGVDYAYFDFETSASAFVAAAPAGSYLTMEDCYAGEKVTLKAATASAFRAHARSAKGATVANCYSLACEIGTVYSGLFGLPWDDADNVIVSNCYNARGSISGFADSEYYMIASGCYASVEKAVLSGVTIIASENMQGEDVFTNEAKMLGLNTEYKYIQTKTYPILKAFVEKNDEETENPNCDIWDGETKTAPQGSGTKAMPYLISNGAELAYAINSGGAADAYYKLTADIYLNDITKINWETGVPVSGYTPNSWPENKPFQGNLNGNGYVVYGLYNNISGDKVFGYYGCGLIPRVNSGTTVNISKLGVDCAYINGTNGAGAFVGFAGPTLHIADAEYANVNIEECYAGENAYLSAYAAGAFRAGNFRSNISILNSYSLATAIGTETGLVAGNWETNVTVNNSYNAKGSVYASWSATTDAVSKNNYSVNVDFTNSSGAGAFYGTLITAENMQGKDVFTNSEKMPKLNADRVFIESETYPILRCFIKTSDFDYPWDGSETEPRAIDDNGNVEIHSAAELAYIIKNGGGSNYVLTEDIYLNNLSAIDWATGDVAAGYLPMEWYTTASAVKFSGSIDGQGHTIYGLYYGSGTPASGENANYKRDAVALIPALNDNKISVVKNLGVDYAYIAASQCAAAIVGNSNSVAEKRFENCYAGENVTILGHVAGGIFGGGDATLSAINCYSLATLEGTYSQGGIFGNTWKHTYAVGEENIQTKQSIENCYTTDSALVGGSATVVNSYAGIGTNCKGQPAIKNFPLYEGYVATYSYPTLRVFKDHGEGNWNGLGIGTFKGEGTAQSPYLVENAGQLAYVAYSGTANHYKMVNDIYINDITVANWQNNPNLNNWIWEEGHDVYSYQNADKRFKGVFDGNGYVVYGIWYDKDIITQSAALFHSIGNGAQVKNVGVKNSYLYAGYTKDYVTSQGWDTDYNSQTMATGIVGGIVGWVDRYSSAAVSGCFTDETVHLTNYANGNVSSVGGIVGFIMNNYEQRVDISDCWSAAQMTSASSGNRQGILGATWNGHFTITNCFSLGFEPTKTGTSYSSLLENAYSGVYSNVGASCDEYTVLTNEQLMGSGALETLGYSGDIWYAVNSEQGTPLHRLYGTNIGDANEDGVGRTKADMTVLRETLIKTKSYRNTDYNRNGELEISDLVKMAKDYKPMITFNANGGTFGGTKTTVTTEQTVGKTFMVETPINSPYTCVGWSLVPDGEMLDNLVTADMDGATLYAVWKEMLVIAPTFKKNMVLQRNKPICIYGTGYGTGEITIGDQTKTVNSTTGEWEIYFDPMEASTTPVTFKTNFSGIETSYSNVLIGDVYIASGQSNMAFALESTEQTGTVPDNDILRYTYTGTGGWYEFTQAIVEDGTAIGVMFATEIAKATENNIPIGIISVSRGASRIDCWTHSDYCYCDEYDFENTAHSDYHNFDFGHHGLYETMIQPIEKMTTAGVLWYQGESNAGIGEAYRYLDMFKTFVNCWRTRMDDPTLPFYTVQIMLYSSDNALDVNGNVRDEYNIRIAQGEAARTMDGVTVCTMLSREDTMRESDGWLDIHPTDKYPVAKALANAALSTYYYPLGDYDKTPEYSGPLYDTVTVTGNTATVTFNHTAEGLMLTSGTAVTELEVKDENGNWVAATATLQGSNAIVVTADGVTTITGVRMGYRNRPELNLYSTIGGVYGYCASPFIWTAE